MREPQQPVRECSAGRLTRPCSHGRAIASEISSQAAAGGAQPGPLLRPVNPGLAPFSSAPIPTPTAELRPHPRAGCPAGGVACRGIARLPCAVVQEYGPYGDGAWRVGGRGDRRGSWSIGTWGTLGRFRGSDISAEICQEATQATGDSAILPARRKILRTCRIRWSRGDRQTIREGLGDLSGTASRIWRRRWLLNRHGALTWSDASWTWR